MGKKFWCGWNTDRLHPQTIRGYYQTVCCIADCKGTALYHCGGDGYCKVHKAEAVKRRMRWQKHLNA